MDVDVWKLKLVKREIHRSCPNLQKIPKLLPVNEGALSGKQALAFTLFTRSTALEIRGFRRLKRYVSHSERFHASAAG